MPEFINAHAQRVSRWSVIALGASIPVSTALDNVLIAIVLVAWMLSARVCETIKFSLKNKWLLFPLLLFVLLAAGTLVGDSPWREALAYLAKYMDLLFIPVFAMAFCERETRFKALNAFAITIAIIVVLSYLIRFSALPAMPFLTGDAASPTVFKLKITHSILVAFGTFLFVWLAGATASPRLRILWITFALLAAIDVLLLVQGATGYLTLGALLVLLGWERTGWRGIAYGTIALAALAVALLAVPNPFQQRILIIQQEIQQWRSGSAVTLNTSTGQRLGFYKNTLDIIAAHPVTGVGTGGFARAYARQVSGGESPATRNPHNEFLNITAQIGIAGLLVLVLMFGAQWLSAKKLDSPMEQVLTRGLVLTLVAGCMVNSLLLDHAEGLFYAWLSGLLYGGLKYAPPDKIATST